MEIKGIFRAFVFLIVLIGFIGIGSAISTTTDLSFTGNGSSNISTDWAFSGSESVRLYAEKINYPPSNEARINVTFDAPMPLNDLENVSWRANVTQGYLPHVDVFLDNGETLVFEYAKVQTPCDNSPYPTGNLNTFEDKGMVDDSAYAWLSSGPAGYCGLPAFDANHKSLADWKTNYASANIIRIEIEIDGWIPTFAEHEAYVDDVMINGELVTFFDEIIPIISSFDITGAYNNSGNLTFSPANQDGNYDEISIDLEYSEKVDYIIYIENILGQIVKSYLGTATDPDAKIWDGAILPDGKYTIKTNITDMAGNSNNTIFLADVIIDNTNPFTTDNSPVVWQNSDFNIDLTPNDLGSGIDYTTYRINSGSWVNGITIPINTEGTYTIEYYSVDNVRNIETVKLTYASLDKTNPSVFLTGDQKDNLVRDADSVLITAIFTEVGSGINETSAPTITIEGILSNMIKVSNLIWTFLWNVPSSDGLVNILITATDIAGNSNTIATGDTSYTVDNTAPNGTVAVIGPSIISGSSLLQTISITYDEVIDTSYTPMINFTNNIGATNSLGGLWTTNQQWTESFLVEDADEETTGVIVTSSLARDVAGNTEGTSVSASFNIDTKAPVISDLDSSTTDMEINNDNDVIISAKIVEGYGTISNVRLEENSTGSFVNHTLTSTTNIYEYIIDNTQLQNQEYVEWRYYATDNLGNLRASEVYSFLVQNRAPQFIPSIGDLSWIEDGNSQTIDLSSYFEDLDNDDLNYTYVLNTNPGPTSNPLGGNITVDIDNITGIATIASTPDWNGNGTIVFYAWDFVGDFGISNTVYVTVSADLNEPPTLISSINPVNFGEDMSISFNLTCVDAELDSCSNFRYDENYINYNSNLLVKIVEGIGTADVTLSSELNWYGETYVRFLAEDDGTPQQTGSIVVKINVTPVNDNPILNIPDIEISEGGAFPPRDLQDYTSDVDNDVWSYNLVSESNKTLIDCSLSGSVISCNNPLADAFGISELIVEVEDGSGGFGNQQFIINVTSVNDNPEILGTLGPYDTLEDVPFTINLNNYESDVDVYDGDAELTWSVSGVDESLLSITIESANDLLIVTPLENKNGATNFNIILNDSFGAQDTQLVSVVVNPVNDAPVLEVIGTQNLFVLKQYSYTVIVNDVDSSPIFSDDTSLFVIGATTGVISFTPGLSDAGEHYVNISVKDILGETDSEVVLFNIIFENEVPVANNVNVATNEDTSVLITLNCTDADVDDVLNYIIVTEPTNGTLSGSVDTRTYYPDANYNGADSFTYKCSDGLNESNIATVDITVNSVNDALRIVSYSPTSNPIIRTETQDFSIVVEDIDSTITYTWEVDGSSVGTDSDSYTYTPVSDGKFIVNVTASDGDNIVSREWTLTVSKYPVANTFTGAETTNFSAIDLSSASGVVLENDYGKIEFLDTLDLSDVFDLDNNVHIEEGIFAIDTSIYPQLNQPARITLTGLSYDSVPEIFYTEQFTTNPHYIDDACDFCTIISYTDFPTTDGIFIFEVEHFSSFAVKGSGITYNLSEFEDLEMCVEGEQGDLIVEIEEPSNKDDFGPGDEIEIEVNVKNNADEDKKIIVEAYLYNVDEDEEVEDVESEYEEIRDGRSETFDLIIIVPEDFEEEDNYILFVKAYEKSDEEVQCNYDAIEVELEREKHKLIISEVSVDSSQGYAGGSLELFVEVNNVGGEDEEDVYITIEQSDLGISEKSELFEIERYGDDDSITKRFNINIPTTALPREYNFTIEVVYDDGEDSKLVTVSLIIRTVFEPVERLDVIELTKPETVISLDVKPVPKISVDKKSVFEPENILVTLLVILIIGIIIELIAIAIMKRLRNRG